MTLRERYEKETGREVLYARAIFNLEEITLIDIRYAEFLEAKLTKKEKPKATLFRDSEWFDLDKFATHMGKEHGWNADKCQYYYKKMLNWSDGVSSANGKEQKKVLWIRVALTWDDDNLRESSGYYKNNKAAGTGRKAEIL